MRRSLTTPDRRQTPPPLAVVRQRKTPAAPRYTVSASGSPVRNENLLLQLKFCSLQSPMHYLSCEKSGLARTRDGPRLDPLGAGADQRGRERVDRRAGRDHVVHDCDAEAGEIGPDLECIRDVRGALARREQGLRRRGADAPRGAGI